MTHTDKFKGAILASFFLFVKNEQIVSFSNINSLFKIKNNMKFKNKISIALFVVAISFISSSFASNYINLNDFLTIYFEWSSPEISNDWEGVDVKYKNVKLNSPLYRSLQKWIYLDMFPNLEVDLPLERYLTQDKVIKLLKIKKYNIKFEHTAWKKVDNIWLKEIISENLRLYITSKDILKDIKERLEENYIYQDKIDNKKLKNKDIEWTIENMDDDYTVYFPKNDAKDFNNAVNWSFEWIGAYIDMLEPGIIIIKAPLKNSPAEKYGLKAWDIILEVDGHKINTLTSTTQLITWVKWPAWTYVKMKIKRWNKEKIFKIKRSKVLLPNIEYEILEWNNCYIDIHQFNTQSRYQFKNAISFFDNKRCEKYIFDVRNNPGWILDDVWYMLNYFVGSGETVILVKYKDTDTRMVASDSSMTNAGKIIKLIDKNIVVLVNEWSASASEIFAWVIKDYVPNSLLLWTQTFGKWSVQSLIQYKDGSMLKYTVAKRYTGGSEMNIDWVGFKPDLELEDNIETEMDEVLEVAKIYKF